jgi:hypothetical protein
MVMDAFAKCILNSVVEKRRKKQWVKHNKCTWKPLLGRSPHLFKYDYKVNNEKICSM